MKFGELIATLDARVHCGGGELGGEVVSACASDMMSEVLSAVRNQTVLITGLSNPQVIRTAEMVDMQCIIFLRGKEPAAEIIEMARERGICLATTAHSMFTACGLLYAAGLRGEDGDEAPPLRAAVAGEDRKEESR